MEPLLRLKHIKALDIFVKDVDLSKLRSFSEVEDLGIGKLNNNMDVSNLKKLQEFYLLYHKSIKGLNSLTALKKLIAVKADTSFF